MPAGSGTWSSTSIPPLDTCARSRSKIGRLFDDRRWPDALTELIPRFIDASNAMEYHLAASELTASINDTHAVTSSAVLSSYWGPNEPPIRTRFIEQQTVVTAVFERLAGGADVRPGDVVTHIDGVEAGERRAAARRYVWGSNEGAVERNINSLVLRTSSSTIALGLSRFGSRGR